MNLQSIVRKNIWNLQAYSSARDEFKGVALVALDANENPHSPKYNRYPDPRQLKVKLRLAELNKIDADCIFIGNGSDEAIDLSFRIFCEPAIDNVVIPVPTYGMYEVCANINNVECRKVLLNEDFTLDAKRVLDAVDEHTKLIFLCSPNNPSGNLFETSQMIEIIEKFKGIVIVDEAYIDFAAQESWVSMLDKYPNLIVLKTLSKAWGLAAIRLGMAFASAEIIGLFNKVKYPYNINQLTQEYVLERLEELEEKEEWVGMILDERENLSQKLKTYSFIKKVYPTDANYILIKTVDARHLYHFLTESGIVVRNRNSITLCEGCIRITVGTTAENKKLLSSLDQYAQSVAESNDKNEF